MIVNEEMACGRGIAHSGMGAQRGERAEVGLYQWVLRAMMMSRMID